MAPLEADAVIVGAGPAGLFQVFELGLLEIHGVAVSENEAVTQFAQRLGFKRGTPRRGDVWMIERNWSAVDWVITRETWQRSSPGKTPANKRLERTGE